MRSRLRPGHGVRLKDSIVTATDCHCEARKAGALAPSRLAAWSGLAISVLLLSTTLQCARAQVSIPPYESASVQDSIPLYESASAQESIPPYDGYQRGQISSFRHTFGVGMVGLLSAGILADSYYTWWKDVEKPFSFYSEGWFGDAHLGMDKVGHFFGSHATFKIGREFLLYAGLTPQAALWWSAGIAAFHSLEIEIGDGFSPWGFSFEDLTMGFLGISYGILQSEVPFFRNFAFKFSYWSNAIKSPANFTNDYDAMTVWLTADVHNLLPSSLDRYWPEFLQIAVGYGVGWDRTQREFVIGLDFNLEAFSPCSDEMLLAQRVVNTMHLPAPAVKLTTEKGPVWYLAHVK